MSCSTISSTGEDVLTNNSNVVYMPQTHPIIKERLPNFWMHDPQAWFKVAEIHFDLMGITHQQSTRFNYTLSCLPYDILKEIKDIMGNSYSVECQYDNLKYKLVVTLEALIACRKQLSEGETPSQLLSRLRAMTAGEYVPDYELRVVWMASLPLALPGLLSPHHDLPMEQVSAIADFLLQTVVAQQPTAVAVSTSLDEVTHLRLAELERRMEALKLSIECSSRQSRRRSRSISKGRPSFGSYRYPSVRPLNQSGNCYYHDKFGDNAKTCTPGCKRVSWGNSRK